MQVNEQPTALPTAIQSILLDTDGTVTDIIRHITGENITVTKLSQSLINDDKPESLQLDHPVEILKREILLTGSKHYLHADSLFVVDRMSSRMRRGLLESDTPIGLLWQQERLESFREILSKGSEHNDSLLQYFPDAESNVFLKRSYLVYTRGKPLGLITERFPEHYFR